MAEVALTDGNRNIVGNALNKVNAQPGLLLFTAIPGKRLSLRGVLLSPSGQNNIRIEDDAALNVLPELNFDTAGGVVDKTFLPGELEGGVGQGLKIFATQTAVLSVAATVFIVD